MITAYIKPTNYCNIDCSHCYLPAEVRADKYKMNDETLHKVMIFLKEMKLKGKHEQIFLVWHGGEPLILSPEYFKNAGNIIDQYFNKDELIEAVQTSLIPFNEKFIEVAHERWRGEIGSSIDFNSRTIKNSTQQYQDLWLSKVELARKNDIFIIPGITPNKADCKNVEYIFNWLVNNEFYYWGMDRYSNFNGDLPDFSTNREHAQFLIDLFNLSYKHYKIYKRTPYIKPIAAAMNGILHNEPGDRWGGKCQSDFVVINPNGSLNNCPDKDSFEESYGHLNLGFDSFKNSPLRRKWIRIQEAGHRIDDCYNCENSTWCKSGCPITGNACEVNGVKDECSGFKSFISHVRNFIDESEENKNWVINYLNFEYIENKLINNQLLSN